MRTIMNILKNKFLIFSIIISLIVFLITLYRASTTGITYDESFTYLHYAKGFSWKSFLDLILPGAWANNHFLNTVLIFFFDKIFNISYSEILIRLPNLLFYLLYLVFSYKFSIKYNSKYVVMSILVLNYGLNEFFGLARGYGISASLVMMGIYYYKVWVNNLVEYKYLLIAYFIFILACYANTVSLIVFATFLIDSSVRLFISKNILNFLRKNWALLVIYILCTLVILRYHFLISADSLPLYGGDSSFCKDVIYSVFNVYGFSKGFLFIVFFLVIVLFLVLARQIRKLMVHNLWIVSIILFAILITSTLLFNQLWITGRSLIPFMPVFCLSICELYNYMYNYIRKYLLDVFVFAFLLIVFISNVKFSVTRE